MVDIEHLVWFTAIAVVPIGVQYVLSYIHNDPEAAGRKAGAAVACISTTLPPGIALAEAVHYALHAGYRLDWVATEARSVVFGIGPDIRTYGFYFPMRMGRTDEGGTTFVIGVVCRSGLPGFAFRDRQIAARLSKAIVCGLRVSEFRHTYTPVRPG